MQFAEEDGVRAKCIPRRLKPMSSTKKENSTREACGGDSENVNKSLEV